MSIDRWDPFRDMLALREAMDRMFQQNLTRPSQLLSGLRGGPVPLDVVDRQDAYVVRAGIPGVKPEDVEITIDGDTLTIRGETKGQEEQPGENYLVREQHYGRWQRSITLPRAVDSAKAEARSDNGVLELTLPKLGVGTARRVPINAGAASSNLNSPGASAPNTHGTAQDLGQGSSDPGESDPVTTGSQESFPASDPPSWTPEKA